MESSQETPAVSVIVPVYSRREYFGELLRLLRRQTLSNIELILIDDCGFDGTYELAVSAAAEDARIVLLRNETNRGPGVSRNRGIAAARGEYIGFVDADDIIPLDYYERLYAKAKETGALVVKCGRANRYEDGRVEISSHNKGIKEKLQRGEHLVNAFGWEHTTAIYQREHVLRNSARNSEALQDEDTTFILGVTHNMEASQFTMLEDLFYYYRMSPSSVTRVLTERYFTESQKSLDDKLDYIMALESTEALERYVAVLIDARLRWRYMNALHAPEITREHRRQYLEKVMASARTYRQHREKVRFYGVALDILEGRMEIDEYMLAAVSPPKPSKDAEKKCCERDYLRELALVQNASLLKRRFVRYKLLSAITFGKTRRRYKEKRNSLKALLREYRTLQRVLRGRILS